MAALRCFDGQEILIDDEDAVWAHAFRWHSHHTQSGVYAYTFIKNEDGKWKSKSLHRLLMGEPAGKIVDHINLNPLDNRRCNLRIANGTQNNANTRIPKHNTSGFRGVCRDAKTGRWNAQIQFEGRQRRLGGFSHAEDAARAYDSAARQLFGEFARCNFPLFVEQAA